MSAMQEEDLAMQEEDLELVLLQQEQELRKLMFAEQEAKVYEWPQADDTMDMNEVLKRACQEDPAFREKVAAYHQQAGSDGLTDHITEDLWRHNTLRDVACYSGDSRYCQPVEFDPPTPREPTPPMDPEYRPPVTVEFDSPTREPTPLMDPESPSSFRYHDHEAYTLYLKLKDAHFSSTAHREDLARGASATEEEHRAGVKKEEEDIDELELPPAEYVARYHEARARDYLVMRKILVKEFTRQALDRDERETLRVFRIMAMSRVIHWNGDRDYSDTDDISPVNSSDEDSDDGSMKKEHY